MLRDLKKLLPEFTIQRDGEVIDIKRRMPDGHYLHIPILYTRARKTEDIAQSIQETWEKECSK